MDNIDKIKSSQKQKQKNKPTSTYKATATCRVKVHLHTLVNSHSSPIYTWIRAWTEIDRGHDECVFLLALFWTCSLCISKGKRLKHSSMLFQSNNVKEEKGRRGKKKLCVLLWNTASLDVSLAHKSALFKSNTFVTSYTWKQPPGVH